MKYTKYSELVNKQLKLGDSISFFVKNKEYSYTVYGFWLYSDHFGNDIIFHVLDIKSKYIFCSDIYGYIAKNSRKGFFPECRPHDYSALTRLVLHLFKLCDSTNYKLKNIKII